MINVIEHAGLTTVMCFMDAIIFGCYLFQAASC